MKAKFYLSANAIAVALAAMFTFTSCEKDETGPIIKQTSVKSVSPEPTVGLPVAENHEGAKAPYAGSMFKAFLNNIAPANSSSMNSKMQAHLTNGTKISLSTKSQYKLVGVIIPKASTLANYIFVAALYPTGKLYFKDSQNVWVLYNGNSAPSNKKVDLKSGYPLTVTIVDPADGIDLNLLTGVKVFIGFGTDGTGNTNWMENKIIQL